MKRKIVKYIPWIALASLVFIQFFPIDKSNPEYNESEDFMSIHNPPEDVKMLLKSACYDCHSYETAYPWYTSIAPVSFWIRGHIDHGRGELNFSKWATYDAGKADHKLEECSEWVSDERMPLTTYMIGHSDARLSEEDRARLVIYFDSLRQ